MGTFECCFGMSQKEEGLSIPECVKEVFINYAGNHEVITSKQLLKFFQESQGDKAVLRGPIANLLLAFPSAIKAAPTFESRAEGGSSAEMPGPRKGMQRLASSLGQLSGVITHSGGGSRAKEKHQPQFSPIKEKKKEKGFRSMSLEKPPDKLLGFSMTFNKGSFYTMGSKKNKAAEPNIELFFNLLLNPVATNPVSNKVTNDMNRPMSHYYIYTGHNSYLKGNQLTSESSTKPIVKSLHKGVRVIELDLWPNREANDILVMHGGTLTKPVGFPDCIQAIKENAFVASEYPVIITLEDHLPPHLQAKAADVMIKILGDQLYYPKGEVNMEEFPSPYSLRRKILVSTMPPKQDPEIAGAEASSEDLAEADKVQQGRPGEGDRSEKFARGRSSGKNASSSPPVGPSQSGKAGPSPQGSAVLVAVSEKEKAPPEKQVKSDLLLDELEAQLQEGSEEEGGTPREEAKGQEAAEPGSPQNSTGGQNQSGEATSEPEDRTGDGKKQAMGQEAQQGTNGEAVGVEKPLEEKLAVGEETPLQEKQAMGEETPLHEKQAVGEETSMQEKQAAGEETPLQEKQAVGEETPLQEKQAVGEETPLQEKQAAGEETPLQEKQAVGEETPLQEIQDAEQAPEYRRLITIPGGRLRGATLSEGLKDQEFVRRISLSETQITNASRAFPTGLVRWVHISLSETQITNASRAFPTGLVRWVHISLSEAQITNASRAFPTGHVRFTQRNLVRVYPMGLRVLSSNYNPTMSWLHGAQMVALNMQGWGRNLWLVHGFFLANGGCGYVLKPEFYMHRTGGLKWRPESSGSGAEGKQGLQRMGSLRQAGSKKKEGKGLANGADSAESEISEAETPGPSGKPRRGWRGGDSVAAEGPGGAVAPSQDADEDIFNPHLVHNVQLFLRMRIVVGVDLVDLLLNDNKEDHSGSMLVTGAQDTDKKAQEEKKKKEAAKKPDTRRQKPEYSVKVSTEGLPADIDERRLPEKTQANPNWEHEVIEFAFRLPELALLCVEVFASDRLAGQVVIPVNALLPGFRCVSLHNKKGKSLVESKQTGEVNGPRLLCHFELLRAGDDAPLKSSLAEGKGVKGLSISGAGTSRPANEAVGTGNEKFKPPSRGRGAMAVDLDSVKDTEEPKGRRAHFERSLSGAKVLHRVTSWTRNGDKEDPSSQKPRKKGGVKFAPEG